MAPSGRAGLADFSSLTLSSLILPPDNPILRDYARAAERRDATYEARYDRQTLAYDHWIEGDQLHLVCPRLLNLRRALAPAPGHRHRHLRWEHLRYPAPGPSSLHLGTTLALAPGVSLHDHFAGNRVLMAVSRNNALDWISDWAAFHVRAQGSDAVLLFDNGSTLYTPPEIAAALARVPGLRKALVVSAPLPYGPAHGRPTLLEVPARFFQTAMFNLARLRMLKQARSVLSLDIDEMLVPAGRRTAHEAAEASWAGLAQLRGSWVYCGSTGGSRPQRDHDHRGEPSEISTAKWCVAPRKLAGKVGWTVHRILGDLDRLFLARDQHFLHCQQTSTGWKTTREGAKRGLRPDPELAEIWARYLD